MITGIIIVLLIAEMIREVRNGALMPSTKPTHYVTRDYEPRG